MYYIECSRIGRIDFSQLDDLLDIIKPLCVDVKLVKWSETTWCPNHNSLPNISKNLDFTKVQKYSNSEAKILQYIYPSEHNEMVSISYRIPVIDSIITLASSPIPNEKKEKPFIYVNKIVESYATKSIMDIIQYLNIASPASNPPTLYDTTYISCYIGVLNPSLDNEIQIYIQTEYKDMNFNNTNGDYISIIIKSKFRDENTISANKQAIINICNKLERIVCFK
ncbi:hypothetical protein HWI79_746 [Cryptosporidium felis]|nr:hypothetical protein HWI79_746 [Cryptosporidium felis]